MKTTRLTTFMTLRQLSLPPAQIAKVGEMQHIFTCFKDVVSNLILDKIVLTRSKQTHFLASTNPLKQISEEFNLVSETTQLNPS